MPLTIKDVANIFYFYSPGDAYHPGPYGVLVAAKDENSATAQLGRYCDANKLPRWIWQDARPISRINNLNLIYLSCNAVITSGQDYASMTDSVRQVELAQFGLGQVTLLTPLTSPAKSGLSIRDWKFQTPESLTGCDHLQFRLMADTNLVRFGSDEDGAYYQLCTDEPFAMLSPVIVAMINGQWYPMEELTQNFCSFEQYLDRGFSQRIHDKMLEEYTDHPLQGYIPKN